MSNANQSVNWKDLPDNSAAIPRAVATVWVKDVETKPSKTGSPMVKLTMEILSPDYLEVGGKKVGLAGRTFNAWIVFTAASRRGFENADTLIKATVPDGLPGDVVPNDIPELIQHVVKGKVLPGVTLDNEPQFEEDARGNKVKGPDGQFVVKRNNIVVKAWVPAVTPESVGITLASRG
jgi:hypothetical protein